MKKRKRKQRKTPRAPILNASALRPFNLAGQPVELIAAASDGDDVRRFKMVAYTGVAMRVMGFRNPVVVDLSGLAIRAQRTAILKDHSPLLIIGHTTNIQVRSPELFAEGIVSGGGAVAQEFVRAAELGFPWQASVGVMPTRVEEVRAGERVIVNGREFVGPLDIVRAGTLREISALALGADGDTAVALAAAHTAQHKDASMPTFEQWLETLGLQASALSEDEQKTLRASYDAWKARGASFKLQPKDPPAPVNATGQNQRTDDDASDDDDDTSANPATLRASIANELKLVAQIRQECGNNLTLAAQAIEENWSLDRVKLEVLRAGRPTVPNRQQTPVAERAQVLEASMLMSMGVSEKQCGEWYGEKTMNAAMSKEHRGAGIHSILFSLIEATEGQVSYRPGMGGLALVRAGFEADRMLRASGGFTTHSLQTLLNNVANKSALASFMLADKNSVARRICREVDHSDFKTHTRVRLTATGEFKPLNQAGELQHGGVSEETYQNKVKTEGIIYQLTREDLVNDDLQQFNDQPARIGRQGRLKLEKTVFTVLLNNTDNFFSTNNKNNLTGADTAFGIVGLTKAFQAFRDQTDLNGDPILVEPEIVLVPTALWINALEHSRETRVNETTATGKPNVASNPHAGRFEPLTTPYLNSQNIPGSSAATWFTFADPNTLPAMEIAYLRGMRTPTIETGQPDFDTLGIAMRGFWDFGVAKVDHRAANRSVGS